MTASPARIVSSCPGEVFVAIATPAAAAMIEIPAREPRFHRTRTACDNLFLKSATRTIADNLEKVLPSVKFLGGMPSKMAERKKKEAPILCGRCRGFQGSNNQRNS